MKLIYIHIDPKQLQLEGLSFSDFTFSPWPDYAEISKKQSEKLYDCIVLQNEVLDIYKEEIKHFYDKAKKGFPSFYNDTFWLVTFLRLYLVYLYAKDNNINEFIHMEYDNLIYSDVKQISNLPSGLYFTQVGPYCGSAGFMYCNSLSHYEQFINRVFSLFDKGENFVKQFTQYDFLSEMIIIDLIKNHTNDIDYLPLFPDQKHFDILNCVFDGASYGQFLGGNNNGNGPGWYGLNHYVGQLLAQKKIEITFDQQPFLYYNNKKYSIANLHIHSKALENFCHV